jgi:tellurite resistance protein
LPQAISQHAALIYTMVLVSAADRDMKDAEFSIIGDIVRHLPVFRGYDIELLPKTASACAEALDDDEGLDHVLTLIASALPAKLRETAYALACDVAAADGTVTPEESRLLELIRHRLDVERLVAAAIERGARARFAR